MLAPTRAAAPDGIQQRIDHVREVLLVEASKAVRRACRAADQANVDGACTPEKYRALAAAIGDDRAIERTVDEIDAVAWRELLAKVAAFNRSGHVFSSFGSTHSTPQAEAA